MRERERERERREKEKGEYLLVKQTWVAKHKARKGRWEEAKGVVELGDCNFGLERERSKRGREGEQWVVEGRSR